MRLMMQSLLAERFKLTVHFETQVVPVLAMVLAKPGKTGPKLRPHSEGVACEATPATTDRPPKDGDEVFPPVCDAYMLMIKPDKGARAGSRNTTMELLAGALSGLGRLERPVVDQTGLSGRFDLSLEWAPEPSGASGPNADATADLRGPEFLETLSKQLGVKLDHQGAAAGAGYRSCGEAVGKLVFGRVPLGRRMPSCPTYQRGQKILTKMIAPG